MTRRLKPRAKKPAYSPDMTTAFPNLLSVEEVQERLRLIFPNEFPDRGILVEKMAARVIFVFLYGGFIEGKGRLLRPSFIYHFTAEQADRSTAPERREWTATAHRSGNRPAGTRWYADTSKEQIRDDLIRNRLLAMGAVDKLTSNTHSTTSSTPVYFLSAEFADLFDPNLSDVELNEMVENWRHTHLSRSTLHRMALRAQGARRKTSDLLIDLPNGERIKVSSGASNEIAKDLVEQFAEIHLSEPAVLWLSASDKKAYPQFKEISSALGLTFDVGAELPDLILADLKNPTTFYFCEIVATDGPVSESRKQALLKIVQDSKIDETQVRFLTSFEDRESPPFRKAFSQLAADSLVWFRTEPQMIVIMSTEIRWTAE